MAASGAAWQPGSLAADGPAGATAASWPAESPVARSATPLPAADQPVHPGDAAAPDAASDREGSVHRRSYHIHADGSGHGGRHFFNLTSGLEAPAAGASHSRRQRWQQARREEYALEQHSLQDGPHPMPAPPGGAGRAAMAQMARDGLLQANEEADGVNPRHQAIWVVEDGSNDGKVTAGPHDSASRHADGGSSSVGGDGSGKGGSRGGGGGGGGDGRSRGKGDFGNAVVVIEEANERQYFDWGAYWGSLPKKIKGGLDTRLPVPPLRDIFWSWLGAFLGILAVCALNQWASPEIDIAFLVGSFGASAVLVFAVLESKMSQPRNFLGGQMLSALVGITTRVVIHQPWIAGPVGMSLALVLMQLTATTHPPGGATALIAATLPTLPRWHGYSFLVTVAVGSLVMQLIALVINNLDPRRRWPTYWW